MRRIRQRDDSDCGVACVATLAGVPYDEARALFKSDLGEGTHTPELRKALIHFGLRPAKRLVPFRTRKPSDLKVNAILKVNMRSGNYWHWVVWDADKGRIIDPGDYERYRPVSYLEVLDREITDGEAIIGKQAT